MIVMFHGNKTRKPRKSKHEQKHLETIFIIAPVTKGQRFSERDWYYLQAQTDMLFYYL